MELGECSTLLEVRSWLCLFVLFDYQTANATNQITQWDHRANI